MQGDDLQVGCDLQERGADVGMLGPLLPLQLSSLQQALGPLRHSPSLGSQELPTHSFVSPVKCPCLPSRPLCPSDRVLWKAPSHGGWPADPSSCLLACFPQHP